MLRRAAATLWQVIAVEPFVIAWVTDKFEVIMYL